MDSPAIVLGEVPGKGYILTYTGLPKETDWQLRVTARDVTLRLNPDAHMPRLEGTTRFTLPANLAGQSVKLTIGPRLGTAHDTRDLKLLGPHMPERGQTLYLGSCLNSPAHFVGEPILDAILRNAQDQPRPAMLWLGDNLYYDSGDWKSERTMALAYKAERSNGSLHQLLRAMPQYAIWDDHDYGPNDADSGFAQRASSQRVFRTHWSNPDPVATDGGLYTSVRRGNVELFLTDNRSYRESLGSNHKAGTMLGTQQIQWLKNALTRSTAPIKLIVGGSQWLVDHPTEEGWQHYPAERENFLTWLVNANITGVLFISGDRHHSALFERSYQGRILTELTCSALTSTPEPVGKRGYENVQFLGKTVKNNFCRISVDPNEKLSIAVIDADNQALLNYTIASTVALLK